MAEPMAVVPPTEEKKKVSEQDECPESTKVVGTISAVIANHALSAWNKEGVFAGEPDPEHEGTHDFDYNSWRIISKGGVVRVSVSHTKLPPCSPNLDLECIKAFTLGSHPRIGADSPACGLPPHALEAIAWHAIGTERGLGIQVVGAGWDNETTIALKFNGQMIKEHIEVGGSAWVDPYTIKIPIPLKALLPGPADSKHHDKHVIELTLEKPSVMVLFLRSIGLVAKPQH